MGEEIQITYFGVKARCAFALPAFAGNLKWKFVKCEDWPAGKASTPFGQLPVMTTAEGTQIGQSLSISHYLGKKASLLGATDADYLMSEQLVQQAEDIYQFLVFFNPRLSSKAKPDMCDAHWGGGVQKQLDPLEKMVKDGKFTSQLTLGELTLFWGLNLLVDIKPDVLAKTPGVQQFYNRIAESPAGQQYLSWCAENLKQYFLNPFLQVTYFGVKARVNFALPAMHGKLNWKFIKCTNWPEPKNNTTFGQLPIMEFCGETFGQSLAIMHYLGQEAGILGKGLDFLRSEQLVQQAEDIFTAAIKNNPRMSSKQTPETCTEWWSTGVPVLLNPLEKMTKDGKLTSEVTLGEYNIFWALNILLDMKPDLLADYAGLKAFYDRIAASEAGQEYIKWCSDELAVYFLDPTKTHE